MDWLIFIVFMLSFVVSFGIGYLIHRLTGGRFLPKKYFDDNNWRDW